MNEDQEAKARMTLERWLEIVRPVIQDFSDRAFQERAWFNRGPEVSSPTELICDLLNDFSFHKTSQTPSFNLSDEQRAACTRFAQMVRAYSHAHRDHLNEREVIDDPEWEKIRQAAAELLKVLPT